MPKFSRPFLIWHRVRKLRQDLRQKTEEMREEMISVLKAIFDDAAKLARGEATVNGRPLTLKEREAWAKVANYTAQIITSISKTIDEKQINEELEDLGTLLTQLTKKQSQTQDQPDRAP